MPSFINEIPSENVSIGLWPIVEIINACNTDVRKTEPKESASITVWIIKVK